MLFDISSGDSIPGHSNRSFANLTSPLLEQQPNRDGHLRLLFTLRRGRLRSTLASLYPAFKLPPDLLVYVLW